ncbi:TIGR03809 family protein [Bradyrhizobium sp. 2TAF24]|uniref:TIGR03809 family protein n=1 Tax=Bradyrhizobium sp. 2TAF24 TaxID=3233011 RepID=UPI003F935860
MTQRPELQQRPDKTQTLTYFARPAVRGRALAEQRLAYLTELFDSGRWRRFHTETDFLLNVREAKAAVDAWRRIEQFKPASGRVPTVPQPEMQAPPMASEPSAAIVSRRERGVVASLPKADEADVRRPALPRSEPGGAVIPLPERGQVASLPRIDNADIQRPPLLPPVMFSTHGIGAERNLLKA